MAKCGMPLWESLDAQRLNAFPKGSVVQQNAQFKLQRLTGQGFWQWEETETGISRDSVVLGALYFSRRMATHCMI